MFIYFPLVFVLLLKHPTERNFLLPFVNWVNVILSGCGRGVTQFFSPTECLLNVPIHFVVISSLCLSRRAKILFPRLTELNDIFPVPSSKNMY